MKENSEITKQALDSLSGRWGLAIGTYLVYAIIIGAVGQIPDVGGVASLILGGPMGVGLAMFTLKLARNQEDARLEQIFDGFKEQFATRLGAYLLMVLYVFLWTLLLIIPGIIAAIAYSQVLYILAEDNEIGAEAALKKSKAMMDGYKMKYFTLSLRFLAWALLCILTLGIGFLWLMPYAYVSYANFYDDIKEQFEAQ